MSHAISNPSYSSKSAPSFMFPKPIYIQNAHYLAISSPQSTMPPKSSRQTRPKKKKLLSQLSYPDPEPDTTDLQVACLLQQNYNDSTDGATITDIFGSSCSSSSVPFGHERILSPGSPSVQLDGDGLARRALRGRERWVFCRSTDFDACVERKGALSLKLDHEEVLTAWSDKGSLYIDGEGPQVVPELLETDLMEPNILVEVGNTAGWGVPVMDRSNSIISCNRRERVMRYKAKRQSRLYSKRIRYEVRKLNAEKRPRIKGRFVKRTEET